MSPACASISKTDSRRSNEPIEWRRLGCLRIRHRIGNLSSRRHHVFLALVGISLAVALFFLAYPNYVIRPQRHQGAQELQAALWVLRYQHVAELLCAAVALGALAVLIRSAAGSRLRAGAIIGAGVAILCAGLSRFNIYEIMFHPAGAPSFQSGREATLDAKEMVLAVNLNNDNRAYPVRTIAYHHIVNDVAGGVPLVATY